MCKRLISLFSFVLVLALVGDAVGAPGSVMVENTEAQLILRSTTPVENEPHQFMGAEIVLP